MTTADSFDRVVCGCSLTGIAVSNSAGGMDVSRATGRSLVQRSLTACVGVCVLDCDHV
jgi:hypothetical protein